MIVEGEDSAVIETDAAPQRRRRWPLALAVGTVALAVGLGGLWLARERLADDFIAGQLQQMGLPAQYTVAAVGPQRQVLRDLVIGDPAHPDLTIAEVSVDVDYSFGIPRLGRITLLRPRLHGTYRDGKASFGSLDRLLFTGGAEPFRMPDYDVAIVDARAGIQADAGAVGIALHGTGRLRGGFAGNLAVAAPDLHAAGCFAQGASAAGRLTVAAAKPRFAGPLRLAAMTCPKAAASLRNAVLDVNATIDSTLDGLDARLALASGASTFGSNRIANARGTSTLSWRDNALTARYALSARGVTTPQVHATEIGAQGMIRGQGGFARIEADGEFSGQRLRMGPQFDSALAAAARSGADTLAAPLLARLRMALGRETAASRLAGSFILRRTDSAISLVVPQAVLRGGSGQNLLALSRFQLNGGNNKPAHIVSAFTTGGVDLPQISGRMERPSGKALVLRMTMSEYRAGSARIAVPQLMLAQARDGGIGFAGHALLSGALPGGAAQNLALPLDGNWSARRGLSLWRKCLALRFDSLAIANLTLDRRALTLCPGRGQAIVRRDQRGTRIAAGAAGLDLAGRLGATPIRIASGPIGFAMPGVLAAQRLDITLGVGESPTRFRIANLDARIGRDVAGRFAGSDILLNAVPLDLHEAGGNWRFANGVLDIDAGSFRLQDRAAVPRFEPLVARDAQLRLANGVITATALLREPLSDRAVVQAKITHDIATSNGHAGLDTGPITFDKALQPDTLSYLAKGVIANAYGTVQGQGRIDWTADRVTSTGSFSTDSLDFAAAFGPAKGVSGAVEFTDLLGLITAPDQRLKIASINPGIEVNDGILSFALQPDSVLAVNGAKWPFLDGTMELLPTRMVLGASEVRRYSLRVSGINAARFLERMDLGNLSASGIFDGTMPLVFDENGGHIEGGLLISRPPGGNVSYVGQLSYKDLSPIANFAFDSLKSLNYQQMRIAMDGALEGEIVTRVRFAGVRQGEGAKRNFITRRLAGLPIQFDINLRAPFYRLITNMKSFFDPSYLPDPRAKGLIDARGRPIARPAPVRPAAPAIQPPVSEPRP